MRQMAMVLFVIGIAALIYGVIDYSNSRTTIEMGNMSASITEGGSRAITAIIAGGIAILIGLGLYAQDRKRT